MPVALVAPYLDRGLLYELSDASSATQEVHLVFTKHSEKALQLTPIIAMLEELDIKPDDPLAAF